MRSPELLAAGYSIVFLAAGLIASRRRRRAWRTAGLALAGLFVAVTASLSPALGGETLRAWWLLGFLPLAYWMPAPLVERANVPLEAWLGTIDRRLGLGPVVPAVPLELSYLLVYPFVPGGLAAVLLAGGIDAGTFWLGVLIAVLPCYGLLPLLPTRPPRALSAAGATDGSVRSLNVGFLAVFGNQWNTLPSGHAAGAVAVAMLVWTSGSPAAPVVGLLAAGICVGTVSGRYHYVVDTVLGMALGLMAWGVAVSN